MFGTDDEVAEARARRNADHEIVLASRDLLLLQFLVALHAGLALGVAARGVCLNPLEFVLDKLLAGLLGLGLAGEHGLLLLEPLLVVALVWIADAVVELENPVRHIAEEVAVVGDDDEGALERLEVFLEPLHGLGVEVVGGLVEEQHVWLGQQQATYRDAATLAARENRDRLVGGRAVHRGHGALDERVDVPVIMGVNLVLKLRHLGLGLGVVEVAAKFLIAVELILDGLDSLGDDFADGLRVVELGLLRQVADLGALRDLNSSDKIGVEASENLEERRLACAIAADDADMRTVEERKIYVLQDGLGAGLLGDVD